ncbi:transposase [Polymorphobacter sp. PAMC 29334]|uniref:IS66-like element accessory protein TnpA n=1 Tax=Polymorphobacter sp. PAMC 29334 TaxID=2862331 RepID=UPI001C76A73B|nr:transposase [Polymorphobacter sp. PAMC 29334]QYE35232.1 transposase [Polymorphobacter sp. PAMC 29334]
MGQVTVYSGVERRRRWSDEQKRALIDAAFAPDAIVAEVARAADVRPSQIYRWRRDLYGTGHAGAGFAPVVVSADARDVAPASLPPPAMLVEIGGSVVRIAADAPAKLVTAVLRSLAR